MNFGELRDYAMNFEDNYIFQNALEDTCSDCKLRKGKSIYECYRDHLNKECPEKNEIEQIEMWCTELHTMIETVAKRTKRYKPESEIPFSREAYEADMRYKRELEQPRAV